jgi:hypothetical protein
MDPQEGRAAARTAAVGRQKLLAMIPAAMGDVKQPAVVNSSPAGVNA